MKIPSIRQINDADLSAGHEELLERISDSVKATASHGRKSVVVLTFTAEWDDDGKLKLSRSLKSKKPISINRNEEVIGDKLELLAMSGEHPGQTRIDD